MWRARDGQGAVARELAAPMSDVSFDPVLARQLKKAGALTAATPPDAQAWGRFLNAVNEHYHHLNEDRALLTRSMELSTAEMDELSEFELPPIRPGSYTLTLLLGELVLVVPALELGS